MLLLNVIDAPAPNTIAKYLKSSNFKPKNPTEPTLQQSKQTWKIFLHNHRLWSMDFLIVPTATFQLLYVLIIINHASRKIEHVNERHLRRLLRSYVVEYYNTNRTHQGIDKKTPIPKKKPIATLAKHTNLKATPFLNGLYHTYDKVSPYEDVA